MIEEDFIEEDVLEEDEELDELEEDEEPEEQSSRDEDAADEEMQLGEYHSELERLDRAIIGTETSQSDSNKVFRKKIKDLKKKRQEILQDIEAFRLGERRLPLG